MKVVDGGDTQISLDEGIKNALKNIVESNYVEAVNVGVRIGWVNAFQMLQMYIAKLPGKFLDEQRMQLFIDEYNHMVDEQKKKENS